jgi:hypothetical protein
MSSYAYDVEVYPNFFSVVFLPLNVNQLLIDAYIKCDIDDKQDIKKELLKHMKAKIFIIYEDSIDDYDLLMDFFKTHKVILGYNSTKYDSHIIDYLIRNYHNYISRKRRLYHKEHNTHVNTDVFRLSQDIINFGHYAATEGDTSARFYKRPYTNYDIQKILYLDKKFVSLKQVAVQLKWHRLQDLPIPFSQKIKPDEVEKIVDYNINDVLITRAAKVFANDEVKLRNDISDLYNINLRNNSRSDMGSALFNKFYLERTGMDKKDLDPLRTYRKIIKFNDIISNKIVFNSPELKQFLVDLRRKHVVIGAETLSEKVVYNGVLYTVAMGGLHSKDFPQVFHKTKDVSIIDADITSFYPYIIINERVAPRHLDRHIFNSIIQTIVSERVTAKLKSKELKTQAKKGSSKSLIEDIATYQIKAEALKIVVNAIYGKLGDENSPLYDLQAMYTVTINGQLYLLMLVEALTMAGFDVISANTDGIVTKVENSRLDEYYQVCDEWKKRTNFDLEYNEYEKYVRYAVNDYLAFVAGFSNCMEISREDAERMFVKEKGLFVRGIVLDKGYNKPIVSKALFNYYAYGSSIVNTIKNCTDIYDFCSSIKKSEDFRFEFHYSDSGVPKIEELQKNVRFYVSNSGGSLIKTYKVPKPNKKGIIVTHINACAKQYVTIFNDFVKQDNYNIKYGYYISQTQKIIDAINNQIHNKMKTQAYGGLFDQIP